MLRDAVCGRERKHMTRRLHPDREAEIRETWHLGVKPDYIKALFDELDAVRAERDGWMRHAQTSDREVADLRKSAGDPDYSPAYQDAYQRLWHKSQREVKALREALEPFADRFNWHEPDMVFGLTFQIEASAGRAKEEAAIDAAERAFRAALAGAEDK